MSAPRLRRLHHPLLIPALALAASCAAEAPPPQPVVVEPPAPVVVAPPVASAPLTVVEHVSRFTPVPVELFAMSQCPYAAQVISQLREVVNRLGPDIELRVNYIGKVSASGELSSMHGPAEVTGNLAAVCMQKHVRSWFPLVECQFRDRKHSDTSWEPCAREAGAPVSRITACIQSGEGKQLLGASFARATDAGAAGSPTLFIGGQKYQGERKPLHYMRAICGAFVGDKPAACAEIPEPIAVNVKLLVDDRCDDCNLVRLESQLKMKIGKPITTTVQYATPEGRDLFRSIAPVQLPAAVFDSTLDADQEALDALGQGLTVKGGLRVMSAGQWNPLCADAGGCNRAECKSTLQCRPEISKKLEVFMMSRCPFAAKGMIAMREVLDNFEQSGERVAFSIQIIGDGDAKTGFKAMHEPTEVDENLRYVCASHHYARKHRFLEYIACRSQDLKDTDWEKCTGGTSGIDARVIRACSEGDEGKRLLDRSQALTKGTSMTASPSWLVNNRHKRSGIDAEAIKTHVCAHNTLKGCDKKLSGPPPRKP